MSLISVLLFRGCTAGVSNCPGSDEADATEESDVHAAGDAAQDAAGDAAEDATPALADRRGVQQSRAVMPTPAMMSEFPTVSLAAQIELCFGGASGFFVTPIAGRHFKDQTDDPALEVKRCLVVVTHSRSTVAPGIHAVR